jgi:hypothetical protein
MRKISAYEIALSALSCAIATIFLTIGVYSEVLLFTGYLFACIALMLPLAKKSWKGGVFTYLTTLLLALLFFGGVRPEVVLTYGIFFGLHPTVNYIFKEKNFNKALALLIKTVWFVGAVLLVYTLFSGFLFEESLLQNEIFTKYAYLILSIGGALLFVCYDIIIARFQTGLDKTIEKLKL